jgi:hypothetical protein
LNLDDEKPYPPRNLSVVPGPNYVDLTWDPPPPHDDTPIINFFIYRNNVMIDDAQPDIVVSANIYNYRDYGVTAGTRYWYSIRSADIDGPGYWGDSGWAVPGKTIPSEPNYLVAEARENAIFVYWDWAYDQGGTALIGYRIYRGTSSDNMSSIATVGAGGVTARYTDTGLVNGIIYYYAVSAYNLLGEGPQSNIEWAKPNWAPRNVTVSPTEVDNCGPVTTTLTWQHPIHNYSDIVGYEIRGTYGVVKVDRENTSYTTTASGGWGYSFQVAAIYHDGNKVYSDSVEVGAPMCEGGCCPICPFLLILLVVFVALIIFLAFFVLVRPKR